MEKKKVPESPSIKTLIRKENQALPPDSVITMFSKSYTDFYFYQTISLSVISPSINASKSQSSDILVI